MTGNTNPNNYKNSGKTDDIDLISFDRRKRSNEIRMNEEYEREKRRREIMKRRKQERIRRAKIARIKALCMLGVIALGLIVAVIGIIVGIVKAVKNAGDDTGNIPDNTVSVEETNLVSEFLQYDGYFYTQKQNDFLATSEKMLKNYTLSDANTPILPTTDKTYKYDELSERYMFLTDTGSYTQFRETVKSTPIFSNGYIWSEEKSMKSTITGGYMYDTNTSFITAVANICLAEGSASFLYETDNDAQPNKDKSKGMTVGQKLEAAVAYLFDGNTTDGGLKFDTISSLCYIHTEANNGTSSGVPSNKWFNFRFGYLDAYTNISFNKAMISLSKLYSLMGENDKADQYASVAKQHASAFNDRFWNEITQRYIGCIDKNNVSYDYGFTFLNLEAIEAGLADEAKAQAIFSWLDGERIIETDTSKGEDIYKYGFAPRNTTVPAEDNWWDYLGGTLPLSTAGGFDKYYQNGGVSLYTAYYDIIARYENGDKQGALDRISTLIEEYNKTGFAIGYDESVYDVTSNALSGLAPTALMKTFFGISTDGFTLSIVPDISLIPSATQEAADSTFNSPYGVSDIHFANNKYGVLYDDANVYITAENSAPVRLKIGLPKTDLSYELVAVNENLEVSRVPVTPEEDGTVLISAEFGNKSYLKLVPVKAKK